MSVHSIKTELLEIVYEDEGPRNGEVILLLHGWPDDIRSWRCVAPILHAAGFRTITPYLRGHGHTRFLSSSTIRDGRGVALAQDAIDLADALGLRDFAVLGHDWGARTAYILAALFPARVTRIAAASVSFQPNGEFPIPSFHQSRLFWYQWFMCVDWVDITLNGYRSRFCETDNDPRYQGLQRRLFGVGTLATPTLMIQGGVDTCDEPEASEGQERNFTGIYRRQLLDGVGHFPTREAPEVVAESAIAHFLRPRAR